MEASDQVLINRENGEILIFPQDEIKDEENWIQKCIIGNLNQDPSANKIFYAKGDSQKLENFLRQEKEKTAQIIKERCLEHSKKCETCEVLSRRAESRKESALIKEIWENVEAEEIGDRKFVIKHTYKYRHDVSEVFPPWKSNIIEARKQAKKVIHKAKKQGNLSDLKEQIQKMENKGAFKVLNEDEIMELGELPHLFTQYNWVFNPNSESTPFRLITNTSAINSGTTISIEQMTPQKILNPMVNSLVRFSLYSVPLCADVASAYHCLLVDTQTALLRLFFWF